MSGDKPKVKVLVNDHVPQMIALSMTRMAETFEVSDRNLALVRMFAQSGAADAEDLRRIEDLEFAVQMLATGNKAVRKRLCDLATDFERDGATDEVLARTDEQTLLTRDWCTQACDIINSASHDVMYSPTGEKISKMFGEMEQAGQSPDRVRALRETGMDKVLVGVHAVLHRPDGTTRKVAFNPVATPVRRH